MVRASKYRSRCAAHLKHVVAAAEAKEHDGRHRKDTDRNAMRSILPAAKQVDAGHQHDAARQQVQKRTEGFEEAGDSYDADNRA